MDDAEEHLQRLVTGARKAVRDDNLSAPLGFSTRVVAQAFAQPVQSMLRVWETLSWRFLAGAMALMFLALVFIGPAKAEEPHEAEILVELTDEAYGLAVLP